MSGASKRNPREAGIKGVFQDSNRDVKIVLSKAIGMGDSNLAKVFAIREAFLFFQPQNGVGASP